ncbi:hypothetical protein L083_7005 [Actinoplanes sp. N902-109]|nr:hypothetical protein L083_7005 [Actinoplanes sp. N902-109]
MLPTGSFPGLPPLRVTRLTRKLHASSAILPHGPCRPRPAALLDLRGR